MQKTCVAMMLGCTVIAVLSLAISFLTNDFSVAYVANNSNSSLAWPYKIAALWGGHEGSFLFWAAGITLALACIAFKQHLEPAFQRLVVTILAGVNAGFNLVILLTSNPFARLLPDVPAEGRDLNPLLQDIGLILHPPLIFLGYIGFTVLFAGAVAALWQRRYSADLTQWLRHWTLLTWIVLTGGNAFGSWWAYHELGWGGWWFWDPVENASFIPWLVATALLHLLYLNRRHKALAASSLILCILGYTLALIGTFLVRSGVIDSVHAFASDPSRGIAILSLLLSTVGPALLIIAWRGTPDSQPAPLAGRSGMTLFGALLTLVAAFAVLLGTCYPILFKMLDLGAISVGPPYFNSLFVPITCLCALLAAIALLRGSGWLIPTLVVVASTIATAAILVAWPTDKWMWVSAGAFTALALLITLVVRLIQAPHLLSQPRQVGMWLAHFGLVIAMLGATAVSNYEQNAMVRMGPGTGRIVADHTVVYEATETVNGRGFIATQARIRVEDDAGVKTATLLPQRRTYMDDMTELTESALLRQPLGDLYLSMGPELEQGEYLMRISYKPGINGLWLSAALMMLGGLLCLWPRRKGQ
ncbi:heme lyase CcmF/NrfE family subunit [Ferrimonas balearica]|uniref:heme lyase CcmF/NrfE family subunit n=1 Tax=Ferrimonas balearica TaxID=44012 RepID=UPI001C9A181C|nr:cytochrome c-type biogenesis CcmF C-terminal domain-containing protein [Ferrimonas balearica]MBY5920647.1 cytochrome c biogenesis protein CcsA [Ferrimonas balearica]MBY5996668.1 cytochrome c biogenesis protein CcsA [Ferrimonas balearica]